MVICLRINNKILNCGLFLMFLLQSVLSAYEGESCNKDGPPTVCIGVRSCPSALQDIKNKIRPVICGFTGPDPLVCCPDGIEAKPVATTSTPKPTTVYEPPTYDYENYNTVATCEPLHANLTSSKTGRKAWDKCIEYQEKYVYPCERSVVLTGGLTRGTHCHHEATKLIVGGHEAELAEFPHMVLLGFGTDKTTAEWLCGGILISERFVLTAGHCTSTRDSGLVKFVRLATLKRTDPIHVQNVYDVSEIIRHPNFSPPKKYNDIALLKTADVMALDQYSVPACLPVQGRTYDTVIATGWGVEKYKGPIADILQKVNLVKFSTTDCKKNHHKSRNLPEGFLEETQMCYGDHMYSRDTCQGDSGGPLQIYNTDVHCMYTVVGITSFGISCGIVNVPGIYTRVDAYTEWIESVVWP